MAVEKARVELGKVVVVVRAQVAKMTPAVVAADMALERKVTAAGVGVTEEGMALAAMVLGEEVAEARAEVMAAEETVVEEDAAAEATAPAVTVLAVEVAAARAEVKAAEAGLAVEATAPAATVGGAVGGVEAAEGRAGWRASGGSLAEAVASEQVAGATAKEEAAVRALGKHGWV